MDSLLDKIKYFLSGKAATITILLLAIGGRIIQLVFLFNIRADRSHQMLATHSFVTGHGISKAYSLPANLSETIYEPLVNWPPGYSLILSPFYLLFNHNYIVAGLILDIFCGVALILITRSILKTLSTPVYQVNLFTLLSSFILYSFYIKSSSDAIAITFFLTALYFSLALLKTPNHRWLQKTTGISFCLAICASMKFLYMPVIFIIPIFLIIKGFSESNKIIRKAGSVSLLIITISLISLIAYQKIISGSATHIAQTKYGFFTENLLSVYPAIPASFINPETIGQALRQPSGEGSSIYLIYQWINFLLFIILIPFGLWITYKKGLKNKPVTSSFFYLVFSLASAITLLLSVLSIIFAKEFGIWTYVQEARYYGLMTILLQLSVFVIFQYYYRINNKLIKYLAYFSLLLLLPEMFRGMIFDFKRIVNFKKEEYSWQTDYKFQQFAEAIIKKEQQKKLSGHMALAGSSPYMNNRISLYSHIPVLKEIDKINNLSSLNTKTSVLLLVVLREDALKSFAPFLSLKEKEDAGQFAGFYFYTVYVEPH